MSYDVGDRRTLSCFIGDTLNVPTDPPELEFTMLEPDGAATVYTYGTDAELIRDGAGEYHVEWDCAKNGLHRWRYEATGAVVVAEEAVFYVRPSRVST